MARLRVLSLAVVVACVGCDHVSKRIVTEKLAAGQICALGGTLVLDRVENTGGFLGFGARLPPRARIWIYGVGVGAGLVLLAGCLLRRDPQIAPKAVAIGLVLGGGIGNWLDRIFSWGAVVDFVQLRLGPLHTGVFNFADMAILLGGLMLIFLRPNAL